MTNYTNWMQLVYLSSQGQILRCENAKISAVRRYLFSARSYMVNYVYYLVCLCFGIFGVKYFAYSYISVLFIRIRPSGL